MSEGEHGHEGLRAAVEAAGGAMETAEVDLSDVPEPVRAALPKIAAHAREQLGEQAHKHVATMSDVHGGPDYFGRRRYFQQMKRRGSLSKRLQLIRDQVVPAGRIQVVWAYDESIGALIVKV